MSSEQERVAVYDPGGDPVSSASRARMRAAGLWHAAAAVLVRSSDGRSVYVHRRTDTKEIYGGLHDCWAGGVVSADESPAEAAARELREELGVHGTPRFLFRTVHQRGTVRFHAFCYEISWDGPIVHQPDEVAAGWWMGLDELRHRLDDPDWPFVPDGRQFIEEWFAAHGP